MNYLEASGELGDRDVAIQQIHTTIHAMMTRGEHRRLVLSNKAIIAYQRFKAEEKA